MQLKPEEYKARFPGRGQPVPAEYAGEWIAWNEDGTKIVAHGAGMTAVWQQAVARGCSRPTLHKIPRGPFVGRA
jgi:hypothetical protein